MHWAIRTKACRNTYQWSGSNCKITHCKLLEALSTLVKPMRSTRELWEQGRGTTSSSPLRGVSTNCPTVDAFPHLFSPSSASSTSYLGDGTLTGLMAPISNLPMIPTGQALLPSFYKWGNWGSEKIYLNSPLDHSDPQLPHPHLWSRVANEYVISRQGSPIQSKRKSHLLVGFGPIQPDAWDHSPKHSCNDDGQADSSSIHFFALGKPQPQWLLSDATRYLTGRSQQKAKGQRQVTPASLEPILRKYQDKMACKKLPVDRES